MKKIFEAFLKETEEDGVAWNEVKFGRVDASKIEADKILSSVKKGDVVITLICKEEKYALEIAIVSLGEMGWFYGHGAKSGRGKL